MSRARRTPLASPPLVELSSGSLVWRLVIIATGVLLLGASARVNVPMYPVPMTLQSLALMVIAALSGARLAGETVGAYLIIGAAGLPVFALGGGLAYFAGPTGGYLLGFLLGAIVIGALADRGWNRQLSTLAASLAIGHAVAFIPGVIWLALGMGLGFEKALTAGFLILIPGAMTKIALGLAIITGYMQRDVINTVP